MRPRGAPVRHVTLKTITLKRMRRLVRKRAVELFAVRLKPKDIPMNVSEAFSAIVNEFEDVFKDELPNELPPARDIDFEINLKSDEPPPVRPVIRLSSDELQELRRQLNLLLQKGFIRPSSSPYGAPVFFVKKKTGELRMVCDYSALNKITIPDVNPLPLISEALDQVSGARFFSKIDLLGAYHQMHIREVDIPKTAIRTRYGSYEWKVLCFGLTNAPASFTRLLSTLLRDMNGTCLVLFIDDILVYSSLIEEHKTHLRQLFSLSRKHRLYAKRSKCKIGCKSVELVGHVVSSNGISMQHDLKAGILDWSILSTVREVQQFVGLANYYRKFAKDYAKIMRAVTDVMRGKDFYWGDSEQDSFDDIKRALTMAPVLTHPSSEKKFVVSTDASKFAMGATLEQDGRPIAYLSHRLTDTEMRWDSGEQELFAIMIALREWDVYLKGRFFTFKKDHEPIRYLQSKSKLKGRQARWLDTLQSYTYETLHVPGKDNVVSNGLSRRPDHVISFNSLNRLENTVLEQIKNAYTADSFCKELMDWFNGGKEPESPRASQQRLNFAVHADLLILIGNGDARVYIPDHGRLRTQIISEFHIPAYFAADKIFSLMHRHVFWKGM